MKKIIVPTDFSDQADNALRVAASLARKNGGEIYLLHLLDLPQHFSSSGSSTLPEAVYFMKLAREQYDEALQRDYLQDVTVHGDVKTGGAFSGIMDTVEQYDADLIIMGSRGASGVKELFVGSNTEKVVRYSDIPVLVIKDRIDPLEINEFIYATDLSSESKAALKLAVDFSRKIQAKLHLVYINTPGRFMTSHDADRMLRDYLKDIKAEEISFDIYNDRSIEEGVFNFAEKSNADMIGMATHGRKGLSHFFNGSVSEDVVNHSKIPVITFKI